MVAGDEKLKEVEESLAETLPSAVDAMRRLLDSTDENVSLGAAKALFEAWRFVKNGAGQPHVPVQPQATNGSAAKPAVSEEMVDELLNQVLADENDLESGDVDESDSLAPGSARTGSAKSAPGKTGRATAASARNGTQEKAAPAKTKPKQETADDSRLRVPVKYWISLGVLSLILVVTWLLSPPGLPTHAALANKALTAENPAERQKAVALLAARPGPQLMPELRRLLKESKDPVVLEDVIVQLKMRMDKTSIPELLRELDNPSPRVRVAAFHAIAYTLGEQNFQGMDISEDDPPEKRERVRKRAQEKLEDSKKVPPPGPS